MEERLGFESPTIQKICVTCGKEFLVTRFQMMKRNCAKCAHENYLKAVRRANRMRKSKIIDVVLDERKEIDYSVQDD